MNIEKILPNEGPSIQEVKKYIEKYSNESIVIKCGGSVLLDPNLFNKFIEDIVVINKLGLNTVLVHGGGKNIKKKLDEKNIKSEFIDGLRITDSNTIKIVEEALTEINSEIIKKLILNNCKAQPITTKKNNIITTEPEKKELFFVGNPKNIEKKNLLEIIEKREVPVVIPMGIGVDNKIYNINADVAAGAIAKKLNSRRLLLMTDVEGVLNKNKELVAKIFLLKLLLKIITTGKVKIVIAIKL